MNVEIYKYRVVNTRMNRAQWDEYWPACNRVRPCASNPYLPSIIPIIVIVTVIVMVTAIVIVIVKHTLLAISLKKLIYLVSMKTTIVLI